MGLACCAIEPDGHRRSALRPRALRRRGPAVLTRQADLMVVCRRRSRRRWPGGAQDLRPDARSPLGDRHGGVALPRAGCTGPTRVCRESTRSSPWTCTSAGCLAGPTRSSRRCSESSGRSPATMKRGVGGAGEAVARRPAEALGRAGFPTGVRELGALPARGDPRSGPVTFASSWKRPSTSRGSATTPPGPQRIGQVRGFFHRVVHWGRGSAVALARQLAEMDEVLGRPDPFHYVAVRPRPGPSGRDVLDALLADSRGLHARTRATLTDRSAGMRAEAASRVPGSGQ